MAVWICPEPEEWNGEWRGVGEGGGWCMRATGSSWSIENQVPFCIRFPSVNHSLCDPLGCLYKSRHRHLQMDTACSHLVITFEDLKCWGAWDTTCRHKVTIDRLEERRAGRRKQGRERAIVSQTNNGTVSKAMLGKPLRDAVKRIWSFPGA